MTTITISRATVEQVLEALTVAWQQNPRWQITEGMHALRAALAQQAEPVEPVAYIHRQGNHWEVSERHLDEDERDRGWTEEPLYTAPPQRKPLTEEEIPALAEQVLKLSVYYDVWALLGTDGLVALVRAVEAKHCTKE